MSRIQTAGGLVMRNPAGRWVPCGGTRCCQTWTVSWNADASSWSSPVAGAKRCVAVPDNDWRRTSTSSTGCTYTRCVEMGPVCAADADCLSLDDTAPPALPFGGAAPPDCLCNCGCCGPASSLPFTIDNSGLIAIPDPRGDWWGCNFDGTGGSCPPSPMTTIRGSGVLPPGAVETWSGGDTGIWPEKCFGGYINRYLEVGCLDAATHTFYARVFGWPCDQSLTDGFVTGPRYSYRSPIVSKVFDCVNGRPSGSVLLPVTWTGGLAPPGYFDNPAHAGEPADGTGDCGFVIVTFSP